MDFDEYQRLSQKTAVFEQEGQRYALMYLGMGLAGEAGEVVEKVKKIVRVKELAVTEERREDLKKEMGDVLWYLSQLAQKLDLSFGDIAAANVKKLADRQDRGVLHAEGDTR